MRQCDGFGFASTRRESQVMEQRAFSRSFDPAPRRKHGVKLKQLTGGILGSIGHRLSQVIESRREVRI